MPYHEGDQVTVVPIASDPYVLELQRYARVKKRVDLGYMIEIDGTAPDYRIFGPIPPERLLPGWRDRRGHFRRW